MPITERLVETRPLVLKRLVALHGIRMQALADATRQANGKPFSRAVISQVANHGLWPVTMTADELARQIEAALLDHGVPADEVKTAWQLDARGDQDLPGRHRRRSNVGRASANQTATGALLRTKTRPHKRRPRDPDPFTTPENEMLSPEAKSHFRLSRDPFIDDVQGPDDVFLSKEQRYIREAMYQTARHGGFLAVIGESGAGKTTLRRDLIDRMARDSEQVVIIQPRTIDKGRLTAGAICDAITQDCSTQPLRATLEGKARQVERILTDSARAGNHHVLLIEEAHDLSLRVLKYLKRFWELEDGFRKLLSVILIGQPELKGMLDERQNPDAREVIRRCEIAELEPLNGNLEEYLKVKFEHPRVGASLDTIFAPDAYDAIRERLTYRQRGTTAPLSLLFPLVVNNAVRKALNLAARMGEAKVTAEIVREV